MNLLQGDFIRYKNSNFKECDIYIVISHSCDIARDESKEPFIELLPCHPISNIDGNNSKGRTTRQLNFNLTLNGKRNSYNIIAAEKIFVKKSELINIKSEFNEESDLTLHILRNWLAARYRRETLPQNINDLFRRKLKIQKKLKQLSKDISAIFLDIDEQAELCDVYFIINSESEGSKEKVENFVQLLSKKLHNYPEFSSKITFTYRIDLDFNYNEITNYVYYNYDYLCEE